MSIVFQYLGTQSPHFAVQTSLYGKVSQKTMNDALISVLMAVTLRFAALWNVTPVVRWTFFLRV